MKKYDEMSEQCTKCGSWPHRVEFGVETRGGSGHQYLLVTCLRCGFSWKRACLDAVIEDPSEADVHEARVLLGLERAA